MGESGRLLNEALGEASLTRGAILVTNVVNSRPPRDEWGAHTQEAIDAGVQALQRVLQSSDRRLVVALGAQAFYACVTGESPPRAERKTDAWIKAQYGAKTTWLDLRGYVFDGPFGPVLAMVHPAFVLRTWLPWRATLTWDFAKAKRLLDGGGQKGERHSHYAHDVCEGQRVAEQLLRAPLLAADSEHNGVTVECVAFAAEPQEAWCFVLPRDREAVAELLASPQEKVWMNAQSDLTVLANNGFAVNGKQNDISLLWHSIQPLIAGRSGEGATGAGRKRLSFLASLFTDEPWWKLYSHEAPEDMWTLCSTDTRVTLQVWEQLWATQVKRKPPHG